MPASFKLSIAFVLSTVMHALLLGVPWSGSATTAEPPRAAPLEAHLVPAPRLPPAPTPAKASSVELTSPLRAPSRKAENPPVPKPQPKVRTATSPKEKFEPLAQQLARQLYYPPQAVAQGLQGTALVTVFFDLDGSVIAVRLERSSSHAILDEAALAAVRGLRTQPRSDATEMLVPVRFQLD